MKRDEAKKLANNALKDLQEALKAGRSEALERYLNVMSRFHKYSWNNCMLIAAQYPEATHVAGFRNWLKLGRHVRKGEKGIAIFAPLKFRKKSDDSEEGTVCGISGFKVVHVFDVSQTDGDDLPKFAQISGEPGNLLRRLEAVVRDSGITLTYEELPLGTKGVSRNGAIAITEGLGDAEHFAVLAHELAHLCVRSGYVKMTWSALAFVG
ncbi:MAG: ArdC-like ssDNA-binding domain-containing protein [Pirellulales bacterium]|nr:ArdC-like ssDNA-binding domain-containing protein [Pirellulales bacterium]